MAEAKVASPVEKHSQSIVQRPLEWRGAKVGKEAIPKGMLVCWPISLNLWELNWVQTALGYRAFLILFFSLLVFDECFTKNVG